MRDVGTLVWVVLVFIGVVSSMVSTIRKKGEAQAPGQARFTTPPARPTSPLAAPPQVAPPSSGPRPRPPAPPAPTARIEPKAPSEHPATAPARKYGLFARKGELVRAVIAMEVLGKPRGLSDEHFPR